MNEDLSNAASGERPEQETAAVERPYSAALRELADWLDAHPDIDHPTTEIDCYTLNEREDAARVIKALGACKKEYNETLLYIKGQFGPITLRFIFCRDSVCVRKVVGYKEIPEVVLAATPETVIPAKREEIVEWECMPILAGDRA